jgi:ATP-dependent RNA helicase DDX10/DBP4
LILSPTRELAVQIFEVVRAIGRNHSLSAGLLTGGRKEFATEQGNVIKMNILVCTPGRLLQHLSQTPGFDVDGLQVLVLDEADRILDLGFSDQLNQIIDYLPSNRQTMLFSATQTKSVKQLARLSLNKPEYISVNETDVETTPSGLTQNYVVCELHQKLDVLFSFIKSHLKKKTVVFFSSCSQVRFINEVICGLQPGIPIMSLHGKIKQEKRTAIYFDFLRKPSAVLIATDVAARGLDFPNVDWVLQMDCPEDSDMYIHRVGRTARNGNTGKSLLCLLPSEIDGGAVTMLEKNNCPIKRINVNPTKTVTVSKRAASVVASNVIINQLAKKAFKSYLKSIHLMPDKNIFQIQKLDFIEYAKSLGLATAPSVRFLRDVIKVSFLRVGEREIYKERERWMSCD